MKTDLAKATFKIAGFGGQGVVLASIVLGRAAILDGKHATQVASYGSESRGGECMAEVVISDNPIDYPLVDRVQNLIVMSQPALSRYHKDLVPGGNLIVDPDMVRRVPERKDIKILEIPAARTADRLGRRILQNMVMLGAIQAYTKAVSERSLLAAIGEHAPPQTINDNVKSAREGMKMAT